MAWVIGGKHFGQYTYDHWFDDVLDEPKISEQTSNTQSGNLQLDQSNEAAFQKEQCRTSTANDLSDKQEN